VRVAYVTAEVPYPLTSGHLRHYHFIRALSRSHAITLLSLSRRAVVSPEAQTALAPFVERLEIFGTRYGRMHGRVQLRVAAEDLRRALAAQLATGTTDAVIFSGKDTFPAVRAVGASPLVVDICDAATLRLRGELAVCGWPRRIRVALRLAELARVERRLAARTPHLLFASERDRSALEGSRGHVVPNGVDLSFWTRREPPAARPTVAFTGVMAYRPNHDAAMRLATRVLPLVRARVPNARLIVAGRDPLPELRATVDGRPDISLIGACPDLRAHLERAALYCAPLRFASGIQNKLLEALAMELPVVTTDVAAAGLKVANEEQPLVVADDDERLAEAIARLLADPARRAELGSAGRRYVERHFSWERSAAGLEAVLGAAAEKR
jgi:glycosyltransferase involved in cell wall biosynthesis